MSPFPQGSSPRSKTALPQSTPLRSDGSWEVSFQARSLFRSPTSKFFFYVWGRIDKQTQKAFIYSVCLGGVRQQLARLAQRDGDDAGAPAQVNQKATRGRKRAATLGKFLAGMFKHGRISGPELQEGAASSSSTADADTVAFARIGSSGQHRGNMHRDAINLATKTSKSSQVYSAKIPYWDKLKSCKYEAETYFKRYAHSAKLTG